MLTSLTSGQRCPALTLLDISRVHLKKIDGCYDFASTDYLQPNRPRKVFSNLRGGYLSVDKTTSLNKALTFASEFDEITKEEKRIAIQARNFLLFNETGAW